VWDGKEAEVSERKRVEDMDERELQRLMERVGRAVEGELPPGPGPRGTALFSVLVFGVDGIGQYISNCQRREMVEAMREFADLIEREMDVTR
jgi:hypothetical protein